MVRFCSQAKKMLLTADNFLRYGDKIWFSELDCNELYSYDLYDGKVLMVHKFDMETEYQYRLFGGLVANRKKIYTIPFSADRMYEVDILTGIVRGIEIKTSDLDSYPIYYEKEKFMSGHSFGDSIYLIGGTYPAIVEYNCLTGIIKYYDTWVKEICQLKRNKRRLFFRKTIMVGCKIYAPSCMGNYVLEFDVKTKKHTIFTVGSEICSYSSICQSGDWMWLSPIGEGPVVKWNRNTNQWKEYGDFPSRYVPADFSFRDIVSFAGYIYCIPLNANMLIRIAYQKELLEEFELGECKQTALSLCFADTEMWLFSKKRSQFIIVGNEKIEYIKLSMPEEWGKYHLKRASQITKIFTEAEKTKRTDIIRERFPAELREYLKFILNDKTSGQNIHSKSSTGVDIYKKLKRLIMN